MTWSELHFTDEPVEVENIVIEPMSTSQVRTMPIATPRSASCARLLTCAHVAPPSSSQVFIMYGSRGDAGVLFQMDFSQLHEPQCKGVESAGSPTSDYELWTPTDGRSGEKCILGHQVTMHRGPIPCTQRINERLLRGP